MEQYQLTKPSSNKSRKRIGRGTSSGHGKTSCRGHKGQKARSGYKSKVGFEGGQMPLQRRVPKRGFNNIFKKFFQIVNLSDIDKINVSEINPEVLRKNNKIKSAKDKIKILGAGTINKPIKIIADAFSISAKESIEKAGGEAIIRTREKIN